VSCLFATVNVSPGPWNCCLHIANRSLVQADEIDEKVVDLVGCWALATPMRRVRPVYTADRARWWSRCLRAVALLAFEG
jgi:hypothetical protein